jgi:hypothetical protein
LQQGLAPSIIENPNQFDLFSIPELFEKVLAGQHQFNANKKGEEKEEVTDDPVIYLEGNENLARLMAMDLVNRCPRWKLLPITDQNLTLNKVAALLSTSYVGDRSAQSQLEVLTKKPENRFAPSYLEKQLDAESFLKYGGLNAATLDILTQGLQKSIEGAIVNKAGTLEWLFKSTTRLGIDHAKLDKSLKADFQQCGMKQGPAVHNKKALAPVLLDSKQSF